MATSFGNNRYVAVEDIRVEGLQVMLTELKNNLDHIMQASLATLVFAPHLDKGILLGCF